MTSTTLENLVKGTAITGLALIGSEAAPEIIPSAVAIIPAVIRAIAHSEKAYTLIGLAASYVLAKRSQRKSEIKLSPFEKVIAGGVIFSTALSLGDILARQVPSLPAAVQGIYESCYTLGGIITGSVISTLACSSQSLAEKLRARAKQWKNTLAQNYFNTATRTVTAAALALGLSVYSLLPETTKARIHLRNAVSRYAFISTPPSDSNSARKWIYETYSPDLAAAETETGISRYVLAGIIFVESRGNRYAVSCTGAAGVMQIVPSTAADYGLDLGLGVKSGFYKNKLLKNIRCDGKSWNVSRECRRNAERHCDFAWDERFYPEKAIPAAARYLSDLMNGSKKRTVQQALYIYSGKNAGYSPTVLAEAKRIRKFTEQETH